LPNQREEDAMSKSTSSFFERFIRALSRGAVPIDASQCDGPCVVHSPAATSQSQHDREAQKQSPIRWLNLR
jgi:hypothetical protein